MALLSTTTVAFPPTRVNRSSWRPQLLRPSAGWRNGLLGDRAGDEIGPSGFTTFAVASALAQSSLVPREELTDSFLCGMPRGGGLVEPGRFLRIDFRDAKLDDAWCGSKG